MRYKTFKKKSKRDYDELKLIKMRERERERARKCVKNTRAVQTPKSKIMARLILV